MPGSQRVRYARLFPMEPAGYWVDARQVLWLRPACTVGADWSGSPPAVRSGCIRAGKRASGAVKIRFGCSRCSWPMPRPWARPSARAGRGAGQRALCTGCTATPVPGRAATFTRITISATISTPLGLIRAWSIPALASMAGRPTLKAPSRINLPPLPLELRAPRLCWKLVAAGVPWPRGFKLMGHRSLRSACRTSNWPMHGLSTRGSTFANKTTAM